MYKKSIMLLACLLLNSIFAQQCKQLNPEIVSVLESVIDEIYHLNADDIKEIVQQDFDCIQEISAEDLLKRMQQESDLLVVNVLSEKWFDDCHIEGSINVPLHKLIHEVKEWDRDQKIVVYCALDACDAGEKAYVLLRCMGFENVVDYHGGIKEWFQLGYPTVGPCAAEYLHRESHRCPELFELDTFKSILKETRYIKRFRTK